jgi:hypothetical protein
MSIINVGQHGSERELQDGKQFDWIPERVPTASLIPRDV